MGEPAWITDDGSVDMKVIETPRGGDFNGRKGASYWTPEVETARGVQSRGFEKIPLTPAICGSVYACKQVSNQPPLECFEVFCHRPVQTSAWLNIDFFGSTKLLDYQTQSPTMPPNNEIKFNTADHLSSPFYLQLFFSSYKKIISLLHSTLISSSTSL